MSRKGSNMKLDVDWQLKAALLSRPINLETLVTMSEANPDEFFKDEKTLQKIVSLLNNNNEELSNKQAKLDILKILGNLGTKRSYRLELQEYVQQIAEWFEEYMVREEGSIGTNASQDIRTLNDVEDPKLHKAVLIVLARAFDYRLKSEDVLELTNNDTVLALASLIGVLEEGFTYYTEVKQRRAPTEGKLGQWERGLVCKPHEKELVLQMCQLLAGFTHPTTYFGDQGVDSSTFSVDTFRLKINQLLALTWDSELVEKVTEALHDNMFPDDYSELIRQLENCTYDDDGDASEGYPSSSYTPLTAADHRALMSMQAFLHNLHNFANQVYLPLFRQHLLIESRLTQDLILPYLHSCCREAQQFSMRNKSSERDGDMLSEEKLVMQGISSSLKTIVIATFRCSRYSHAVEIFWTLNPTYLLLEKCTNFITRHEAVLALLVFFNVNLGTLDQGTTEGVPDLLEENKPAGVLLAIGKVFAKMDEKQQKRVMSLVEGAGQLPLSRDVKSYLVALHLLNTLYSGEEESGTPIKCDEALIERVLEEVDNGGANWYPDDTQVGDDGEDSKTSDVEESKGGESESKMSSGDDDKKEQFRLLGDLPNLGGGASNALSLPPKRKKKKKSKRSSKSSDSCTPSSVSQPPESPGGSSLPLPGNVPEDYVCAINGHIMKEPVRVSSGKVYEKSTLELWVSRSGSVCPITGQPLTGELAIDKDLQTSIMRWHIQQAIDVNSDPFGNGGEGDDDLYAF